MNPRSRSVSEALAQLAARAPRRRPPRPRSVRERRRDRPGRALPPRVENGRRAIDQLATRSAHQLEAWRQARDPRPASARGCPARANPRPSRALRCARALGVGGARRAASRPERRDEGVEVCAADARRALHELQAIRQEHAHERSVDRVGRSIAGAPSTLELVSAGRTRGPTSRRVRTAVADRAARPVHGVSPKRTSSRSFEVRRSGPMQPK